MINFHAVILDECGHETGVSVRAANREEAYDMVRENYPESNCVQLESPEDTQKREAAIYASVSAEYDDGEYYDEDY